MTVIHNAPPPLLSHSVISLQFQKLWNDSWFLLELKSTKTIHNCEQSLVIVTGRTPRHLCFPKTHGGEFQFGNGTAVLLPLELNLSRLISREMAVLWLEQQGGPQNARLLLWGGASLCNTLHWLPYMKGCLSCEREELIEVHVSFTLLCSSVSTY